MPTAACGDAATATTIQRFPPASDKEWRKRESRSQLWPLISLLLLIWTHTLDFAHHRLVPSLVLPSNPIDATQGGVPYRLYGTGTVRENTGHSVQGLVRVVGTQYLVKVLLSSTCTEYSRSTCSPPLALCRPLVGWGHETDCLDSLK